jgi:hypothetical protein
MDSRLDSNTDLVMDLMNFSPHGPWGQVFITEAIRKYAEMVIAQPKSDQYTVVSQDLWKAVAKDVKERCDAFYNRSRAADDGPVYDEDQIGERLHAESDD